MVKLERLLNDIQNFDDHKTILFENYKEFGDGLSLPEYAVKEKELLLKNFGESTSNSNKVKDYFELLMMVAY